MEFNRKRPVYPRDGPRFVPGTGPVCPRYDSSLSRTPSRQKCLGLLIFSLPDQLHSLSQRGSYSGRGCEAEIVELGSQRAPKSTETQKGLKWPTRGSKVTRADRPQSDPKVTQKWLRTPFLRHFWVTFESLGVTLGWGPGSHFWVTFGSLWGPVWVSVELGARWLPNNRAFNRLRCHHYCIRLGHT